MPWQPRYRDALFPHCPLHTDVVEQDGTPAHQHPRGRQVHEPVEDGQGVIVQSQESEEHEGGEQHDADVRRPPAGRAQEDLGGLSLQRETVEDARARQQALVAAAPGAGDDDGIDQAGDGADAGGGGGDDEGALRGGAAFVPQARVVASDEHADDEHRKHVEEQHADEDLLARARDGAAGVLGLGGGHGDGLDARKREDGRGHDAPEAEEFPPVARGDILDEGAGVLPVEKANARGSWDAAEVDDEAEDDEKDDEEDLEDAEKVFHLAKD